MDGTTSPQGPSAGRVDDLDLDLSNLILEVPGLLVAVVDQNNRLTRANPSLERMSGCSQQDLREKTLQAIIDAHLVDLLGQVRLTGAPQELEADFHAANGEPCRVRWNFQALPPMPGWIIALGIQVPSLDRPEAVSHNQQHFLKKILGTESNLIYIYDAGENRFTFGNRSLAGFMGYPAEFLVDNTADPLQALLHPDDAGQIAAYQATLAHAADDEIHELEFRLRHADGDYHWILNRGTPFSRDPHGRVRQILGVAMDVTPRHTAEELHWRLVEIIETTPDVVATLRPDGTLVYLNWAGRELFGLHLDNMTGWSLRDIAPRSVVEQILKDHIPAAMRDSYWAGDAALTAEDGEQVAVSLVIVAHPSATAEVEYLSLIARDMRETLRMQAELRQGRDELELRVAERTAELHRSEALYRTLAEAAPDMVFIISRDGQVEYLNQVAAKQFKLAENELVGRFITELFPPTLAIQHMSHVRQVFKSGMPYISESVTRFTDGDRWLNTILVPIRNDDGSVASVLGVARDVTSRRQIEDELFQSRQMLQLVLDNIPQRVFWKDREMRYLGANRAFLRDVGLESLDQVLGKDDFSLSHKNNAEFLRADDRQVMESGEEKFNFEEPQPSGQGDPRWLRTSKIPLRDRDGAIFGLLGTYDDITERKRAEMLLDERNRELTRSNAELEQFAYIASHDLQEPLRMVASYAQLFSRRYQGTLDERGEKYLGYMVDGAYRMQQLIDDLLMYSRVGTHGRDFAQVNCNQVTAQALFNLQVAVRETGAKVSVGPLPTIWADEIQILQLFQNLIGNAIKFHTDAAPDVRIAAGREEGAWRFGVSDNGIGIDAQFAERIFVIFQRLHSREEYPGTGIGLAMCKKIVTRHGGRIWFESLADGGTTFYFTIPDRQAGV